MTPFVVPIGKYKSRPITDADRSWLAWMRTQPFVRADFAAAIDAELARRAAAPAPTPAASSAPTIASLVDTLARIDAVARELRPLVSHDPAAQARLRQAIATLVRIATPSEDGVPF